MMASLIYHIDTGKVEKFKSGREAYQKWAKMQSQGKKVRLVTGLKG